MEAKHNLNKSLDSYRIPDRLNGKSERFWNRVQKAHGLAQIGASASTITSLMTEIYTILTDAKYTAAEIDEIVRHIRSSVTARR